LRYFITGAAGFIGSNLVDRVLRDGHEVVGYDDFSTGQPEFLAEAQQSSRFSLVQGDTLDLDGLTHAMRDADFVFTCVGNDDDLRAVTLGPNGVFSALKPGAVAVDNTTASAEIARELAYRLYTLCERKKRAPEALAYNALVQSWPEISRLAREGGAPGRGQADLFDAEE